MLPDKLNVHYCVLTTLFFHWVCCPANTMTDCKWIHFFPLATLVSIDHHCHLLCATKGILDLSNCQKCTANKLRKVGGPSLADERVSEGSPERSAWSALVCQYFSLSVVLVSTPASYTAWLCRGLAAVLITGSGFSLLEGS